MPRERRVDRSRRSRRIRLGVVVPVVVACLAAPVGQVGAARPLRAEPTIEPQVCSGCNPPLVYLGGPVLSTSTLTVSPVYWQPKGAPNPFPAGYESIIDRYVANVAAASGSTDNVYSIDSEYYEKVDGRRTFATYSIHAGTPIVDTNPFPGNGCTPASGYTACITDNQLRTELTRLTGSRKLPTDLTHFYPVFFPPKVELMDRDGTTSAGDFCGYHRSFGSGTKQTVYSNEPFNSSSACNAGQAPNGNLAADGAIDTFSHELNEAITDPLNPQFAWGDKGGHEIGDMCGVYGQPLGSTSPSDAKGTEYNQVINGGKYYTQAEFSNLAFSKLGYGKGCALSEALAQHPTAAGVGTQAATVTTVVNDATPTTLPADGKSTSTISMGIADQNGLSVQGDRVHFRVGVESGTGQCGKLSSSDKATNAAGNADVTYNASTDDVACWVLASEAEAGRSAEAVIYQGTTKRDSPTFHAAFPTSLEAGAAPTAFTMKAVNPRSEPIPSTRVHFVIFPGSSNSKNVDASQVHLSYSTTGTSGKFTVVPLKGSTGGGNAIQGYLGPTDGATLPPNSTTTYTLRVGLADNVPASKAAGPLVGFEGYLDQVNSASGSGATLADTYATDIKVPTAARSNTLWYVLIGVGVLFVVAAIAGALLRRRRGSQPGTPPPAEAAP